MRAFTSVLAFAVLCAACSAPVDSPDRQIEHTEQSLEDIHWHNKLSPDVPHYNVSDVEVTARAGPGLTSPPIGSVAVGGGGYIQACDAQVLWCELPLDGTGETGWVLIKDFGGMAR